MDLSLLPDTPSEYNKQRTAVHFTVRSANSPSYSLTRRSGVRKREIVGEFTNRERYGTHTGINGTNKENNTVTGYQTRTGSGSSDITNRIISEFGTGRRENPVSECRGRSEWRNSNLTSRSKSLDWRTGDRSPDRSTRADISLLSIKTGQAGTLEGRHTGVEGGVKDKISSLHAYSSASTSGFKDQILERASRGNTLPSRLRSLSGCQFTETASSLGPKGGQSILERIEKLYGSAGLGKVEDYRSRDSSVPETSRDASISPRQRLYEKNGGGTLPRSFFSRENISPEKSRKSFIWTQIDTNTTGSETSFAPGTNPSSERSPGAQWQGQSQGKYSEEGGAKWDKGFVETGTRSLDRARSKSTVAAQIRSARAAEGVTANTQPNVVFQETSVSFRDSSEFRERKTNGGQEVSIASQGDEKSETNVINEMREKTRSVKDQKAEMNSGMTDEDVFETNLQKTTLKTAERMKVVSLSSEASVRNKINQFEALTQRATGQAPMPRRTFSVPTPVSRGHDGVKKSKSAKEIGGQRKKREGLKERGEAYNEGEEKVMGTEKNVRSGRSFSVDEVGLRIQKELRGLNDLEQEGKNCFSDCGKYSGLKTTLRLPLSGGAQSEKCYTETDFSEISSPEDASDTDMTANNTPTPLQPCDTSQQEKTHSEITLPESDDDKTPTNSPSNLLIISPMGQPESSNPIVDSENKSTSVFTHADKNQDSDSPPYTLPASSQSSLQDLFSPDVETAAQKGKKRVLDLNTWIAGLNPNYKVWNDDDVDDDDDDESTQKDEDSNYDSDSGESSVTITSNMSQSDRRSFCVSLSDLCNFAGADYESENDIDEWPSIGRRSASLSSDMSAFSCVSVLPTEELDKLIEDVRNLGEDALQDYDDVQVVVLHKEVGVGLGFSLAGGVDQNKPITVHKVFHSGVAAQEGSVKEGDQVLSINGTALSESTHWEALRVLRRAKTRDMVVVVLRRGDVTSAPKKGEEGNNQGQAQAQYNTGQQVCVQLQKKSRDLGFSLEGGKGSSLGSRPLTVQKIFQGGPVNMVYPGDELLEIQGTSVVGMRRLEAWTLIRELPLGPVDVVLHRPLKHQET